MRFKLELAYDGTRYSGWQIQPNAITVQAKLEQALSKVFNQAVQLVGCGRTDAGVHAKMFFAHFDLEFEPDADAVFRINQVLPSDIAVINLDIVNDDFHARFDARSRTYEYYIHFQKDPFLVNKSYFSWKELNLKALNDCCTVLLRYTDFASFCKAGADNKTSICELEAAFWEMQGKQLVFTIKANRFLRNMVRAIVGTMLDVGLGKSSIEEFKQIIEAMDRGKSGKSAAACGLYLMKVDY